ncbi:alpha/beta fold hydrolase [Hymenobacter weizhouensis]|uniref:alpha/beta fold hydrolase n=1 Tax=Hymenobacter sp. YIM 151500-1 TaxID=2987689 RepID=UPI0022260CF1|nr:alpha/beta fold hydrolase [Hymenobacter sp. YIM 151500-1]UYZ64125.1 alpha/beta fold hydrolase [Hymenobacter sp. YIM 151500-1]
MFLEYQADVMRITGLLILLLLPFAVPAQDLNAAVYDRYLGTYQTADHKELVIGRSFVRLFSFDPQTFDFRGLYRLNDTTWFSGKTILPDTPRTASTTITFLSASQGPVPQVLVASPAGTAQRAVRATLLYREEAVRFKNGNTTLSGTLLLPDQPRRVPAVVLLHGSGEQNRHGYASYMRIIADHLAKNGIAVLTYDKRGCGSSTGRWQTASFRELAEDALQARQLLAHHPRIDPRKIGFGGSSQAGWILAKLTALQPDTPFIFCLSGAGMGTSAAQQNLYNTATELRANGATEAQVAAGVQAWRNLYNYVGSRRPEDASKLDASVAGLASTSPVRDFLPPLSTSIDFQKTDQWFQALEITYDPTTDWAAYRGSLLAMFGELDASTPVQEVSQALTRSLTKGRAKKSTVIIYPQANHLLLRASTRSDSEFGRLTSFEPHFLPDLSNWLLAVTTSESAAITQVKQAERAWLTAYEQGDTAAMKNILADTFTITFPNGLTQTKQQVVKELPNLRICCPGARLYTSVQRAADHGKTVVLTGVVTTEFLKNGVPEVIRQRYTDTYAYTGRRWQVVTSRLVDYK